MKISRFISRVASAGNRQFRHSSSRQTIFSLTSVIPRSRHIHPARACCVEPAWEASLSHCVWPPLIRSLITPASDKEGFPAFFDPPSLSTRRVGSYLIVFPRTMSDKPPKQMKALGRKLLSRRRHLSLARAAIGKTHKSGISPQRQHPIQTRCQSEKWTTPAEDRLLYAIASRTCKSLETYRVCFGNF